MREILEEHVEELAILWRLRSHRLRAPEQRLLDLSRLDERIDAHADAIGVAGEPAAGLLEAGLQAHDPAEVFASAYGALRAGLPGWPASLRELLGTAEPDPIRGLRDALVHAPGPAWREVVEPHLAGDGRAVAVAAEVFAFRGAGDEVHAALPRVFAHQDAEIRAWGWQAAAHGAAVSREAWIRGFEDPSPSVRGLALEAAAWQGHPSVVEHLREVVRNASPPDEIALLVLAWLAQDDDAEAVLQATTRLTSLRAQARILGALGTPPVIPRLIDLLWVEDPRVAAAASLALTRVTGWDVDSRRTLSLAPEDASPDDEVEQAFDEVVVLPDPERAGVLWRKERDRFEAGVRWSHGIELERATSLESLGGVDLESLRAHCLRGALLGLRTWSAARLEAFPQPRL